MSYKIRQTISTQGVGSKRQKTYQGVISQYHLAMANGFYIEAIALMESIIGDRLESYANELSESTNFSHSTLEKLLIYLYGEKQSPYLTSEIKSALDEICCWKDQRNMAIHEMAKDINQAFVDKYDKLEEIAEDGYDIFRNIDKAIGQYRKNNSSKTKS